MTQQSRPSFELLLGEVSLKAPETPLYLRLATQVLEARRLELEDRPGPEPDPEPAAPDPPSTPPASVASLEPPPAEAPVADPVVVEGPSAPAEGESSSTVAIEAAPEVAEVTAAAQEAMEPEADAVDAPTAEDVQPDATAATASSEAAPSAEAVVRRARWFRGQLPVVNFEDGSSQVMDSLDALKDLLRSRGLTPHPRGDASMLLWQVRNRLGLSVDQVDA